MTYKQILLCIMVAFTLAACNNTANGNGAGAKKSTIKKPMEDAAESS